MAKRRRKKPLPELKWYCLKVRSGKAKAVKKTIERAVKELGLKDYISRLLIPRKRQLVLKKSARGERRAEERRMRFGRGYLFVHAALKTRQIWTILNSTEFSLGLMPYRYNPNPIPDEEIAQLLLEQKLDNQTRVQTGLKKGDEVLAVEGMFEDMKGEVLKVAGDRTPNPKITVRFLILGKPIEQEFKHFQIRKATNKWPGKKTSGRSAKSSSGPRA